MQLGGSQIQILNAVVHKLIGTLTPFIVETLLLLLIDFHNLLIQKKLADLIPGDFLVDDQILINGVAEIPVVQCAAVRTDHVVKKGQDSLEDF